MQLEQCFGHRNAKLLCADTSSVMVGTFLNAIAAKPLARFIKSFLLLKTNPSARPRRERRISRFRHHEEVNRKTHNSHGRKRQESCAIYPA